MTTNKSKQRQTARMSPTTGPVLGTWIKNISDTAGSWQKVVIGELDFVFFGTKIQIFYFEAWRKNPASHLAPIPVTLFGLGSATAQAATAFMATWPLKGGPNADIHFADGCVAGHVEGDLLVMDTFTTFFADNPSYNYYTQQRFSRV
jgi:hypothetical protein